MTTYPLRSRRLHPVQFVVGTAWFGGIFAFTVLPVFRGDAPRDEWLGRIGIFVVFLLIGVGVSAWERRSVSEIRVTDDGAVQLVRGNGRMTTIAARSIQELDGQYRRDYDGNYTIWGFSLRSGAGRFRFGEFDNVMDFVEQVRAHHPDVRIVGHWPVPVPWEPLPPSRRADDRALVAVAPDGITPIQAPAALDSYTVRSVEGSYVKAIAWLGLAAIVFSLIAGPVLWGDRTDGVAMRVIVGSFFGLVIVGAAISTLRQPAEILVLEDGTIVFNGAVGSTRMRARDIQYLDGNWGQDPTRPGGLAIRFPGKTYTFNAFPDAMHLVERIRSHYPEVKVRGAWPLRAP